MLLEPAPGFGKYRKYFPKSNGKNPDAVAHPAKMHTGFCEYLITRYTEPAQTILDPMSGSGTTAVVGASLGRNVIAIELEPKFVEWQNGMKRLVEEAPMLTKGSITIIEGDARQLDVAGIDAVLFSPPYEMSEAWQDTDFALKMAADMTPRYRTTEIKSGAHLVMGHARSTEAEQAYLDRMAKGRIEHPDSIGRLAGKAYSQAMTTVYQKMYAALKPKGLAIIVLRPFNRKKQIVDLPWHTLSLFHSLGFELVDVIKVRLNNLSFWRIQQYKKNPHLEQIRHEYAIVMKKSGG